MCGIAGIFVSSKASLRADVATDAVKAMTLSLVHRGPDGHGLWTDEKGRCVLGHRRLSIIDTSDAGLQPMPGADDRWMISFNGEIYNYRELKPLLQAAGVQFKGRTDTEVLLEAIALWGANALPKLDGMFAFAAFDKVTGKIFLARDAFGEKPLYYTTLANGAFAFASELQALELLPGFDATASLDAMAEVLSFQYIGAPRSIYESVHKLEPGSWMEIDADGGMRSGRFYRFEPQAASVGSRTMADLADELEDILVRSLERRLIADVPLGAFLSGGVDSSVVCALVRRRLKLPLKTFSSGFSNAPESEHLTARKFAEHLGTQHYENLLSPDVSDFLDHIGGVLDEPNGDSSCLPTFLLSKFVREHVTVAVSGDGGDELFGGYGRYFVTLDEMNQFKAAHGDLKDFRPGDTYYGGRIVVGNETFIRNLFGFVPQGYQEHLDRLRDGLDAGLPDHLLEAMRRSDVANYLPGAVLPKVDRMSMRNSLEVRTPFLNTELARFAERLPESVLVQQGRGKLVLRELAYRYLPRDLIDLPKQGFALPMSDWARDSLMGVAQKVLLGDGARLAEAFGWENINRYFQLQSRTFSPYQMWGVVMLESWLRSHPAVVPLGDKAPRRKPPRPVLDVLGVAPGIFLVAAGVDAPGYDPTQNPAFNQLQPAAWRRVQELTVGRPPEEPEGRPRALRLPYWGEPLADEDLARLKPLQDSTLVFVELDAMPRLDHREHTKLLTAGVRRVLVSDSYRHEDLFELEFQPQSKLKRMTKAAGLYRHRAGGMAGDGDRKLFGLYEARIEDGGVRTAGFETIKLVPDRDVAPDYAVFDGMQQLLPLYGSGEDLARQSGRYSMWNQTLRVAPINREGAARGPFWFVPVTPQTIPDLQITVKHWRQDEARDCKPDVEGVLRDLPPPQAPTRLGPGDRVVVHTAALPAGGAERQWLYLARSLKEAGYAVTVVTSRSLEGAAGQYLPDLAELGVQHVDATQVSIFDQMRALNHRPLLQELSTRWMPDVETSKRLLQLAVVLERLQPKAVFSQLDEPNLLAGMAGLTVGVPKVVLSFRNYNPTNLPYLNTDWMLPAYRLLASTPTVVFSGNFTGANEDYARWIGIDPARVAHVPNVIDPQGFPEGSPTAVDAVRKELGMKAGQRLLLGVLRLSEEKDPFTFVDVCVRLCGERDDLVCAVAGGGRLEQEVRDRIAQAGLADRIKVLGPRRDVNVLMSAATLLLQTSRHEGMPNAVMEAQLLGLPVVATAAGGTGDVVVDGDTGILCPIADKDALVAACGEILDHPAKAKSMGEAARSRILKEFGRDLLGPRYVRLVESSIAQDEGRPKRDEPVLSGETVASP